MFLQPRQGAGDDAAIPGTVDAKTYKNAWAGATVEDVEVFAWDINNNPPPDVSLIFFLVLDEKDVQDRTVTIASVHDDSSEEDDESELDEDDTGEKVEVRVENQLRFDKVRVPWHGASVMCANLEIANMGFEEYCDNSQEPDEAILLSA